MSDLWHLFFSVGLQHLLDVLKEPEKNKPNNPNMMVYIVGK